MKTDFNGNKLGMFIHWGIYSQLKTHEQAFAKLNMPREEYEALQNTFDPVKYDPEEWVLLAKNAGMKYICFTAKHHDGFCMFDTKYTDYNVMNTPYGKDVLKMLADACRKHGMKLSIYYSNPDWHCPFGYNPNSTHQWRAVNTDKPDTERYVDYVKKQMTELLTNYGEIYTLFWDIPPKIVDKSVNELARKLQPGILINDRGFDEGDFSTPEREHPGEGSPRRFDHMTEACNSVGQMSWGYRENEDHYTTKYLLSGIDKVMAMGGSYLLNVGPKPDGTIDKRSADIIKAVGKFYCKLDGILEKTEPDTFDYGWLGAPFISNKKNSKTYFHFYDGLISSGLNFRNYPSKPKSVRLLNSGKKLPYEISYLPSGVQQGNEPEYLSIHGIPAEKYPKEPIVIEIEW